MASISSNKKQGIPEVGECIQNRELSWLKFNERVLEEANFSAYLPLERLKFIAIFNSNLDEFFMIRVGSLTDFMLFAPGYYDNKTGMSAEEQLNAIFQQITPLYALKDRAFASVMGDLGSRGVHYARMGELDAAEMKRAEKYFRWDILPLLSPQIIDSHHPFPHIDNKQPHIAVTLERKNTPLYGLLAVPDDPDRLFFPGDGCRYVLLEDLIRHFAHIAFAPFNVMERTILAVTRNADINTEEDSVVDEDVDYRQYMKNLIKKRQRLAPVRLEFQDEASKSLRAFFCGKLNLAEKQVFLTSSPLDLSYCLGLEELLGERLGARAVKALASPPHVPAESFPNDKKINLMKLAQKQDILFSYPFDSVSPFLEMIRQAAEDPAVVSIKITLYRLDVLSKLAESLIRAAENGKDVTALMELRARFDEANNIEWSHRMDEAGCRVIFGLPGLKVHSKICLITRKDFGGIQFITQIGTGNYNERTSKQYTDLSLITANREIGNDAALFFNNLLLGYTYCDTSLLWVSPHHLKDKVIQSIDSERIKAERGEPGRVIIKCNSLTDKEIILALIAASRSGVRISMIVRSICCLIPGIPGLTDNITVISVVGRFLEHSRIFCFGEGDDREIYISSADLMTRNTERRIEIACPILDQALKKRVYQMLETLLQDNVKAWEQYADGRYLLRAPRSGQGVNSQEAFVEQAREGAAGVTETEAIAGKPGLLNRFSGFFRRLA
ncbi:MAG: polyphosphate kinase 1 [Clostridiales bacterium]|nr:polyphosphate kinase 1 [Clostridiales bacterium]